MRSSFACKRAGAPRLPAARPPADQTPPADRLPAQRNLPRPRSGALYQPAAGEFPSLRNLNVNNNSFSGGIEAWNCGTIAFTRSRLVTILAANR